MQPTYRSLVVCEVCLVFKGVLMCALRACMYFHMFNGRVPGSKRRFSSLAAPVLFSRGRAASFGFGDRQHSTLSKQKRRTNILFIRCICAGLRVVHSRSPTKKHCCLKSISPERDGGRSLCLKFQGAARLEHKPTRFLRTPCLCQSING